MFSSFSSSISFVILLISSTTLAVTFNNNVCKPSTMQQDTCHININVPQDCRSATLNLAGTKLGKLCKSAGIFWNYPVNNLTVIIQTLFTQASKAFFIRLQSEQLETEMSNIYQVSQSGVLTKLKNQNGLITVKSDAKYQVILKFQAPTTMMFYGAQIEYDVVKIKN